MQRAALPPAAPPQVATAGRLAIPARLAVPARGAAAIAGAAVAARALAVAEGPGRATVTVENDGPGDASLMVAAADRVGALGGSLAITEMCRAEIPCASS